MKIVVIGGSIAGIACALRLQGSGHSVSILERRFSDAAGGFGMVMDASTNRALQNLGVSLQGSAHEISRYRVHDLSSDIQSQQALDGCSGISRQRLMQEMRDQLRPGTILYGAEFDRFIHDSSGRVKAAALKAGSIIEADLFIAADGVRSRIREKYVPGPELTPVKSVEVVGVSQFAETPPELIGTFKKLLRSREGAAMGMVPTADHQVVWYFQWDIRRWPQALLDNHERKAWLKKELQSWPAQVRKIVSKEDLYDSHLWRTTDRDLPSRFHRGNVVLVGDAAHPLLTFTSQGVGSALEDGLLLGDALEGINPASIEQIERSLSSFASERLPILQQRLDGGRSLQRQFLGLESQSLDRVPVCA